MSASSCSSRRRPSASSTRRINSFKSIKSNNSRWLCSHTSSASAWPNKHKLSSSKVCKDRILKAWRAHLILMHRLPVVAQINSSSEDSLLKSWTRGQMRHRLKNLLLKMPPAIPVRKLGLRKRRLQIVLPLEIIANLEQTLEPRLPSKTVQARIKEKAVVAR